MALDKAEENFVDPLDCVLRTESYLLEDIEALVHECVEVANIAMMIASRISEHTTLRGRIKK